MGRKGRILTFLPLVFAPALGIRPAVAYAWKRRPPRNPDGSFTGEAASGTVTGTPCIPNIVGVWEDTHAETHMGKEGEEALTTRSFLVCSYGGLIEIIRSGQEDSDE